MQVKLFDGLFSVNIEDGIDVLMPEGCCIYSGYHHICIQNKFKILSNHRLNPLGQMVFPLTPNPLIPKADKSA